MSDDVFAASGLDEREQDEARRIYERVRASFDEELKQMACLMASKEDSKLLGESEFQLRDRVHGLGAQMLEAAADERQKKGRVRGC